MRFTAVGLFAKRTTSSIPVFKVPSSPAPIDSAAVGLTSDSNTGNPFESFLRLPPRLRLKIASITFLFALGGVVATPLLEEWYPAARPTLQPGILTNNDGKDAASSEITSSTVYSATPKSAIDLMWEEERRQMEVDPSIKGKNIPV